MICTVINFCTNDWRFLDRNIAEARKFSDFIIVSVSDHFFDGTAENITLLSQIESNYQDVQFIEFAWNEKRFYMPLGDMPADEETRLCLWHSTARFAACHFLPKDSEFVMFLDADEIPEGERLADWIKTHHISDYSALWFLSYTYRFSASERKSQMQYAPLLVRVDALERNLVLNTQERYGLLQSLPGSRWIQPLKETAMFHHYSWVRSKRENLLKVKRWAKRYQENWPDRLQTAWYNHQFLDTEPFSIVEPYFDPMTARKKNGKSQTNRNVIHVNDRDLFRRSIEEIL